MLKKIDVLIIEDDVSFQKALKNSLKKEGYTSLSVGSAEQGLKALESNMARLIISDIKMDQLSGLQLLTQLKSTFPNLPVLMMTAYGTVESAVEAIKSGASDYLMKPFDIKTLIKSVEKNIAPLETTYGELPSNDSCMKDIVAMAGRVAKSEATVLIQGESGTGKEVISRFIHKNSNRNKQPFIAINCAAIPENMLEAMLFGYEKGAFTGATQGAPGKFELAQGGTLLLDEISEMNISLQAKLLRVLQEKEVERLGGRKTIKLNVRVLATTNRNLREFVEEGKFREDLLYRINVFPIIVPPLRDRKSDIMSLAKTMVARHYLGESSVPSISTEARVLLENHAWQGNVRELENVIQRALIMMAGTEIKSGDLIFELGESKNLPAASEERDIPVGDKLNDGVKAVEDRLILDTLVTSNGSRKNTAERLGISARTLRYKIARMRNAGVEIPA